MENTTPPFRLAFGFSLRWGLEAANAFIIEEGIGKFEGWIVKVVGSVDSEVVETIWGEGG